MIQRLLMDALLTPLAWLRRAVELRPNGYALFMAPQLQDLLERISLIRVRGLFEKAAAECPAYARFLQAEGYVQQGQWTLTSVPISTKANYVKRYTIEERCFGGRITGAGSVLDESSGSSGLPNNWVRNASERKDVSRILRLSYGLIYGDPRRILLNCFALGPWATGMHVSMSLADVGILKSLGPDVSKLENTLLTFGPGYRYLVFGYPPFVKSFVDRTSLDLSTYHIDLVVGGEGISEPLREYLLRHFHSVISSYGASDLEINIGVETEWTIALRALCSRQPGLCERLFGRDTPPMIFQYNPLDYHIETLDNGELVFTICRASGAAPKIRYNLRDEGGTYRFRDLMSRLGEAGLDPRKLAGRFGHFPVLFLFGRSDLTVAFFGAKIYPADLESTLIGHPQLARAIHSFQFSSEEDAAVNRRLKIQLELAEGVAAEAIGLSTSALGEVFYQGIARSNQDFREVSRMFTAEAIQVALHPKGTHCFEGSDIRLKRQYVKPANA